MPESAPLLELRNLRKSYGTSVVTEVLHGINLRIERGEFVALIGPSGSGKSTLLNQVGLLDTPTAGDVLVRGEETTKLSESERTLLRHKTLGFVFQFHHLIGALSALQNLLVPLAISGQRLERVHRKRALEALELVGLADRADARPDELSGGQQQRVAIARALVHEPDIVLADEPTGNLDTETANGVFATLREVQRQRDSTFVIVTHDPRLAERCDRIVEIVDGKIARDERRG